jgi:CBS domain-containing protein
MAKLVQDIMTPVAKIIFAKEETPVTEIAGILSKYNFNGLPVLGEENELKGMLTERDLLVGGQKVYLPTFLQLMQEIGGAGKESEEVQKLKQITAGQVMKTQPFTVHPSMPIEEVAKIFAENHINPIPVVELGKLVGIVSRSDLVKMLAPEHIHEKPREQMEESKSSSVLDPLFQKAVVRFEKGYIVVDRLRVRLWWVFLLIAFVIGFFVSIAWIIRVNL